MTRGPTATTVVTGGGGGGAGRKDSSSEYPHSPKAVHPSMATPTGSFGSGMASKPIRIKTTAATTAAEEVHICQILMISIYNGMV